MYQISLVGFSPNNIWFRALRNNITKNTFDLWVGSLSVKSKRSCGSMRAQDAARPTPLIDTSHRMKPLHAIRSEKWCISKWINMSAMGWLATKTAVYWFETNELREAMVHNPFDGNVWQFPPTENHTRWWFDQARLYVRWNERGMVTPVWRTWCFWFVMSTLLTCSFIGDVATHISCPRCYKIMK